MYKCFNLSNVQLKYILKRGIKQLETFETDYHSLPYYQNNFGETKIHQNYKPKSIKNTLQFLIKRIKKI